MTIRKDTIFANVSGFCRIVRLKTGSFLIVCILLGASAIDALGSTTDSQSCFYPEKLEAINNRTRSLDDNVFSSASWTVDCDKKELVVDIVLRREADHYPIDAFQNVGKLVLDYTCESGFSSLYDRGLNIVVKIERSDGVPVYDFRATSCTSGE